MWEFWDIISFHQNIFRSFQIYLVPSKSIWFPRNTFRSCLYCRTAPFLYAAFIYCRLIWHVTWIHFEGRKSIWRERNVFGGNNSIWRERNLFGGNEMYFEGTMLISRERNVFRGNEMYFEGTKYIWKDRNIFRWNEIISQNSHMSL